MGEPLEAQHIQKVARGLACDRISLQREAAASCACRSWCGTQCRTVVQGLHSAMSRRVMLEDMLVLCHLEPSREL